MQVVTCECFRLPDFMLAADDLLLLEYVCAKEGASLSDPSRTLLKVNNPFIGACEKDG